MRILLLVGLGGFLGAVARYLIVTAVQGTFSSAWLPPGLLMVNLAGCLAIGAFWGMADGRGGASPEAQAFLVAGMLGGFTTFSSFGMEVLQLVQRGAVLAAVLDVVLHAGGGVMAAALGYRLGGG